MNKKGVIQATFNTPLPTLWVAPVESVCDQSWPATFAISPFTTDAPINKRPAQAISAVKIVCKIAAVFAPARLIAVIRTAIAQPKTTVER